MKFKSFLTSVICLQVIAATFASAEEPVAEGRIKIYLPESVTKIIELTSCTGSIVYKHPSSKMSLTYRFKKGSPLTLSSLKVPKELVQTEGVITKKLSFSKLSLPYVNFNLDINAEGSESDAGLEIESYTDPKVFKIKKKRFQVETHLRMRVDSILSENGNTLVKYKERNNRASIKIRSRLSAAELGTFELHGELREIIPPVEEGGEPTANSIGGFDSDELSNQNYQLTTTLNCDLPTE